jgi:hypothetical protein
LKLILAQETKMSMPSREEGERHSNSNNGEPVDGEPADVVARSNSEESLLNALYWPRERSASSNASPVHHVLGKSASSGADADILSVARQIYRETSGQVPMKKLVELVQSGELAKIPRCQNGKLTSVGALGHPSDCKPCAYWFKGICKYSIACRFCHRLHEGQRKQRIRPSKETRAGIRKMRAAQLNSGADPDADPDAAAQALSFDEIADEQAAMAFTQTHAPEAGTDGFLSSGEALDFAGLDLQTRIPQPSSLPLPHKLSFDMKH